MSIDEPDATEEGDVLDPSRILDAATWLKTQAEQGSLQGCVIVTIEGDNMGFRCFGHVQRYCMAMAGALLTQDALTGRFEEEPEKSDEQVS